MLHCILGVLSAMVFNICKSFVDPWLAFVIAKIYILDLSKSGEYFIQMFLKHISCEATNMNLGGGWGA
jgi:hypothetical protein